MATDLDAYLDARPADPDPWPSPLVTNLLATLGPLAIWGVAFGLAALLSSPDVASGQCEGIGWGCTLSPQDSALFVGVLVGVPAVAVATLLSCLALLAPPRVRPTVVCVLVGLFATGTVLVAAGIVLAPMGG